MAGTPVPIAFGSSQNISHLLFYNMKQPLLKALISAPLFLHGRQKWEMEQLVQIDL